MLIALMRSMKPKILDSFKDQNIQKEFLAKKQENKAIVIQVYSSKKINHNDIMLYTLFNNHYVNKNKK